MPSVYSVGSKIVGAIPKSKPVKWICNQFKNNYDNALIYTTIGSVVAKDGVGCGMYVYQSLHNDKIPEKRRNFVAALDLTNGLLMILTQIALFLAMHKMNKPLFDKLFSKTFGKEARKALITQTRIEEKAYGLDKEEINNVSKKIVVGRIFDKYKKSTLKIFEFATDLIASAIIGKRIIVPLIATPLAAKVEKKMNEHCPEEHNNIDKHQAKDRSNPSMQGMARVPAPFQLQQNNSSGTNLLDKYRK